MNTSNIIVLRDFSGSPEITPDAFELKRKALALAAPITKVETEAEQIAAVAALKDLKAIRTGMEATRKAIKAPVLDLGSKIDETAANFLDDTNKAEKRLQGLINHFQLKQLAEKNAQEEKARQQEAEATRLADEAKRKREEAERTGNTEVAAEATKLETQAFDVQMATELSPVTVPVDKPRGLVVKNKRNFEITAPVAFIKSHPQFFTWNAAAETFKVKRRELLEEINRQDGKGIFETEGIPASLRVFEELKSHVR